MLVFTFQQFGKKFASHTKGNSNMSWALHEWVYTVSQDRILWFKQQKQSETISQINLN